MTHPIVTQLTNARRTHKIRMYTVAARMNLSAASLSKWEHGQYAPTLDSLQKWAAALGYSVLLAEDGRPLPATYQRIVPALIEERAARKIPQNVLAARMGVLNVNLCGWEKGRKTPSLQSLDRWATALGYTLTLAPCPTGDTGQAAS